MSDGKCLRNAFSLVSDLDQKRIPALYVQGTVTNPASGKTFQHAWVELIKENMVLDPTIDVNLPKKEYYKHFSVKNVIQTEPFTAAMLCSKELKFFTQSEVTNMEQHIKELDARMAAKKAAKRGRR